MKRRIIAVMAITLALFMNGCSQNTGEKSSSPESSSKVGETKVTSSPESKTESKAESKAESKIESKVESKVESSSEHYVLNTSSIDESSEESIDDYGFPDAMYTDGFENEEFLIYKTQDRYYTSDKEKDLHVLDNNKIKSIGLENGEFVLIKADGTFYTGGVAGYYHDPMIDSINSAEKLTWKQVFEKYDIPELSETKLSKNDNISKYTSGDDVYLILRKFSKQPYDIYLNSEFLISADEKLCEAENIPDYIEKLKGTSN